MPQQEVETIAASTYGYIRVSTKEQNEDRQLIAMRGLSVAEENIFMDRQSGKDFRRPQYQRMGYGKAMLTAIMERYQAAYQMELLTDDTQKTVSFYRSVGFKAVDEIGCRAFMRM